MIRDSQLKQYDSDIIARTAYSIINQRVNTVWEEIKRLTNSYPYNSCVLDLGSNGGEISDKLVERFGKNVDVLDCDQVAIDLLSMKQEYRNVIHANAEDLVNLEIGKYNIIIASHLLYYIQQDSWIRTIKSWLEFLHPGGVLIIILASKETEFLSVSYLNKLRKLLGTIQNQSYDWGNRTYIEDLEIELNNNNIRNVKNLFQYKLEIDPKQSELDRFDQANKLLRFYFRINGFEREIKQQLNFVSRTLVEHGSINAIDGSIIVTKIM